MSFESHLDDATLTVLLDVRHPLAYLALGPTIGFGRERGLEINWLPLSVPPLKAPPPRRPDDDRSVRHRRKRAEMIAREIATYGAAQGLLLRETYRDGDAAAVALGWLFVREHAPALLESFLQSVFAAYWAVELDPADDDAVAAHVNACGADVDSFRAWAGDGGPAAAVAIAEELRSRGMTGVPGYWVAGEMFLGRQHLPMIAWLLDGRQGPGPI